MNRCTVLKIIPEVNERINVDYRCTSKGNQPLGVKNQCISVVEWLRQEGHPE